MNRKSTSDHVALGVCLSLVHHMNLSSVPPHITSMRLSSVFELTLPALGVTGVTGVLRDHTIALEITSVFELTLPALGVTGVLRVAA